MKNMKKIIILMAVLLLTVTGFSQETKPYNQWAVDAEFGLYEVNHDKALNLSGIENQIPHFGASVRYNFNPKFGLGIVGGFDNMELYSDDVDYNIVNADHFRFNVEAYINLFKVLDLNPKVFTMLLHGGPGVSYINGDNNSEWVGNLSGGITGLFKVRKDLAIKLDFTTTGLIEESGSYDGSGSNNEGINSTIHNISVGLTYYFKKKGKSKPHADWYVAPEPVYTIVNEYTVNNYPKSYVTNVIENTCDCDYLGSEYVFFDHDLHNIKDTFLPQIYKVKEQLIQDESLSLVIKGWASPTSSTDDYNLKLSKRRSNEVYNKYIDMGIDKNRIEFDSYGKDRKYDIERVHDVARRVELILVRNK